jgi:hypothetical protein
MLFMMKKTLIKDVLRKKTTTNKAKAQQYKP